MSVAGGDLHAGDVGALAGEDLGLLAGLEDGGGGEDGARLVRARDDLLEIGEGAVNQLGDQLDILHVEDDLAASWEASPW